MLGKFESELVDVMLKYSGCLSRDEQMQIVMELAMGLFFKDYFEVIRILKNRKKQAGE